MVRKDTKVRRAVRNFYSFENYKPNKNAKPVVYNGTQYLSKAQCMALENISRKELDEYLSQANVEVPVNNIEDVKEDINIEDNVIMGFNDDADISF